VSENRFLQSFSALLASAILVCGTHLLLIASQEYGRPELEPATEVTSAPTVAEPSARESIEVEITGTTEARSQPDADQVSFSPTPDEAIAASEANTEVISSSVQTPGVDASSSETTPAQATEEVTPPAETAEATPSPKVAEAAPAQPTEETNPQETAESVPPPSVAEAAPAQPTEKTNRPQETPESLPMVAEPTPAPAKDVAPAEKKEVAPAQEIEKEPVASSAELPAVEAAPSEAPKPIESATAPTAEGVAPAAPRVAGAEDVTPVASAPVATKPEAQSATRRGEADVTPPNTETTKVEPAVANVPLPTRRSKVVVAKPTVPTVEPKAKEATVEPKPRWRPMALAPADKDTVAKSKLERKRAVSVSGYNAKIWSALARHKPKAGKAGSAVVTFAIGPAGGLRSARISGSSGEARLDQMALQTVRSAAPFPPPPNPTSASYTIRIYFR
jgi:protein TonB